MTTASADNIQVVVDQIFEARRINRATQQHLMRLLLNHNQLTPQEQTCVSKIFDALHRGMLRVVD
ncbi:hypothetical protein C7271_02190 [filamentous cyanobacterium CCP5]|nr:hypothetical protein C7271_02190 [filamentous cyanobacterium CCP5]